jgi:ABC-2 type transport system ATP-binding protein
MKQKLALICSLVHAPKVLLLDEPTNGVDPLSRRDFWGMLRQLREEGVTIFVSTSYLDEADRCRRVALMHRGRMMAVGTPAELRGLMRETIIELRTDQPREALAAIRREMPETSAGMFGDRLHLASAEPERIIAAARAALAAAGIEIVDIRPIAPTLEDVFISMMAEEEAVQT